MAFPTFGGGVHHASEAASTPRGAGSPLASWRLAIALATRGDPSNPLLPPWLRRHNSEGSETFISEGLLIRPAAQRHASPVPDAHRMDSSVLSVRGAGTALAAEVCSDVGVILSTARPAQPRWRAAASQVLQQADLHPLRRWSRMRHLPRCRSTQRLPAILCNHCVDVPRRGRFPGPVVRGRWLVRDGRGHQ